eukprot:2718038-Rhodomonas_salina.2
MHVVGSCSESVKLPLASNREPARVERNVLRACGRTVCTISAASPQREIHIARALSPLTRATICARSPSLFDSNRIDPTDPNAILSVDPESHPPIPCPLTLPFRLQSFLPSRHILHPPSNPPKLS